MDGEDLLSSKLEPTTDDDVSLHLVLLRLAVHSWHDAYYGNYVKQMSMMQEKMHIGKDEDFYIRHPPLLDNTQNCKYYI